MLCILIAMNSIFTLKVSHYEIHSTIVRYYFYYIIIIYCYVTTISFLTVQFITRYRTQFYDECSVHNVNKHIHLICELPATVNVYRAECALFDVDWHIFPNISPFILHNVFPIHRKLIARYFRISHENGNKTFKQNFLYPNMKYYLWTGLEI